MVKIELKGLEFFAYHGLYDHEREKGGWFKVDIGFYCEATAAIEQDKIEGTVNYEEVYQVVKQEMSIPSKLVEHVAGRIYRKLQQDIQGLTRLTVQVYKLEPPLGGRLEHVSITLGDE